MAEQRFCQGCSQRHNCRDAYQKLGNIEGRSVVSKVVLAFLVPIVVFIVSLATFERILAETINMEWLRTGLAFLSATSATFLSILLISAIIRRFGKRR